MFRKDGIGQSGKVSVQVRRESTMLALENVDGVLEICVVPAEDFHDSRKLIEDVRLLKQTTVQVKGLRTRHLCRKTRLWKLPS